jgi:hypothetical protein
MIKSVLMYLNEKKNMYKVYTKILFSSLIPSNLIVPDVRIL